MISQSHGLFVAYIPQSRPQTTKRSKKRSGPGMCSRRFRFRPSSDGQPSWLRKGRSFQKRRRALELHAESCRQAVSAAREYRRYLQTQGRAYGDPVVATQILDKRREEAEEAVRQLELKRRDFLAFETKVEVRPSVPVWNDLILVLIGKQAAFALTFCLYLRVCWCIRLADEGRLPRRIQLASRLFAPSWSPLWMHLLSSTKVANNRWMPRLFWHSPHPNP